ncbi:MAG TPA: 1-(5-phosphoribosyl)-5-[(5-phosphoribosylamino)methylideneamino]imidazole-4-carboxamide isomerase [Chitinophagaceae bacterium]|nr:1-(5-phosphoribosyl)-5-[(5-phosphoribosylamino)methylideneamino]imidazole-4-carboxamide isomerase [Chitinophagaceae bacterium]
MDLIPAIDLIDGKCVRLSKGDYSKKVIYSNYPVDVASSFEGSGIKRLHIVDLDGAAGEGSNNLKTLENIAGKTNLVIDFGGGLKSTENVSSVLNAGASIVNVGSVIVKDPELFAQWIVKFGAEKFLPGADVLDRKIKIHGWKEETDISLFDFIKGLIALKLETIFCTDISKDGMLMGPSIELYKDILIQFSSIKLIASGGVSTYDDLVLLKETGCEGAIIGKAFYEERITLKQMENFIRN